MTRHSSEPDRKTLFLRRDAENRLREGSAPPASDLPLGKEALTLLYSMAGSPERSSDALKLLQELQVHQVELDLQREELRNNELEMSYELALYKALFERTPAVCLVATMEGRIVEANVAAANLLNTVHGELAGRSLHDFLKPESHEIWNELLGKMQAGETAATCEVLVGKRDTEAVTVKLSGSFLPEGNVLLFGITTGGLILNDTSKHQ